VIAGGGSRRIWIWDTRRETLEPLTVSGGYATSPVWTRDGQRLAFSWSGLWWQAADGNGSPERFGDASQEGMSTSFAPDGRLVFTTDNNSRLALLTHAPAHRVDSLILPPGVARNGEVSPDGHFLAYETTESGQSQVLVRQFPNVEAGHWQVSSDGGTRPAWSHDGTELFFVGSSGGLMRVQVQDRTTPTFSAPSKLVEGPYSFSLPTIAERPYDVSRQGDRFLVMKPVQDPQPQENPDTIVVVQNWFEELKARVPTK
jgi:eukaryotic-like serine/threonine-protein kinase